MSKVNLVRKMVNDLIINDLSACNAGYVTTSGNMIMDLGLDTDDHAYDDYVFTIMSQIHRKDLLRSFNKKLVVADRHHRYSRYGRRSANLYRVEDVV